MPDKTPAPAKPPATPATPPPTTDPAPATPARLPGRVTAAAIVMLVFGTLSALASAFTLLWSLLFLARMGGGFGRFRDGFDDGFGGGIGFASLLFVALAVGLSVAVAGGHLAAGWGILQRLPWARILGMVVSAAALVLLVLGVLGTLVWVAAFPDLREIDRIPEWWTNWIRSLMTAAVGFGVLVSLAVGAAYGFVLVVLARADEVFDRP
ncbi:MAG TPA: hypothetical protein VIA02_01150 [Candidatus Limnocylindria bacterium]|jgi:hypothetical protein